ncbi:hypothetical protein BDR07DRAFT_1460233 [Suillus spraguei]|nr:hypothetical protein BDR07DRAFT_1460233 [Suillus spraguei]
MLISTSPLIATTAQKMQSASSRSSLTSVTTDPSILSTEESVKVEPHAKNEKPVVSIEVDLVRNMSNTLEQILSVLKTSSIAEDPSNDDISKFWVAYKKVSDKYDADFLKREHGNVNIILTFAGLLTAAISTFIGGMQPDSGDTTNALLVQLIQVTVNGPSAVHDISKLSATAPYSYTIVWAQALAYIALALSILAAFGAVVVKQCLTSFEATRKRGRSLEERGTQRQKKWDDLQHLHLPTCLQIFLGYLQIALLLFSISLSLNTWTGHLPTFVVMVSTAALVILFYAGAIFVGVWWPDSPLVTLGTVLGRVICTIFANSSSWIPTPNQSPLDYNISSPLRWMLETPMSEETTEAAAAIMHLAQYPLNLDVSTIFQTLRANFEVYGLGHERYVKFGKAMANLLIQPAKIHTALVDKPFWHDKFQPTRSHFIREAFMDCRRAYYSLISIPEHDTDMQKHQASIRTALRTMLVHGLDHHLSLPDNDKLIWNSNLCWSHPDGHEPSRDEFDWLIDYLADEGRRCKVDEIKADEIGDALLVLSAMGGLGSPVKRSSYIKSLIACMTSISEFQPPPDQHIVHWTPLPPPVKRVPFCPRVRHAALRNVYEVRSELASITSSSLPEDINPDLLDELSSALFTVMVLGDEFNASRDLTYIHIIFAMTKNPEWCRRLAHRNHLQLCINIVTADRIQMYDRDVGFYLAVIIGRLFSMRRNSPFDSRPTQSHPWWTLIRNTWMHAHSSVRDIDYIDGIPALVTATKSMIFSGKRPADIITTVQVALDNLNDTFTNNGISRVAVEAAISSVLGLLISLESMQSLVLWPREP